MNNDTDKGNNNRRRPNRRDTAATESPNVPSLTQHDAYSQNLPKPVQVQDMNSQPKEFSDVHADDDFSNSEEGYTTGDELLNQNGNHNDENGNGNGNGDGNTVKIKHRRNGVQDNGHINHYSTDGSDEDLNTGTNVFVKLAKGATQKITQDLNETQYLLRNFTANPTELLHLIEHWLTVVFGEFTDQAERIKLQMQKKYINGELKGPRADVGIRKKGLLNSIKRIEQWKKEGLNNRMEEIKQVAKYNSDGFLDIDSERMKPLLDKFLDDLIGVNQDINEIANYKHVGTVDNSMDKKAPSTAVSLIQSIQETSKFINTLKDLAQKLVYTIVILGLEKAGKSTFINALLQEEIVPTNALRCTQVLTLIANSPNPYNTASVEFYSQEQYKENLQAMKENQKNDTNLTEKDIKEACDKYVGQPLLKIDSSVEKDFNKKVGNFVSDPLFMCVVKKVTIFTNKLPSDVPIEIIDAPGIDSPLNEHRIAVSKAIADADAFILLMSGQRPSLTKAQVDVLNEILGQHYDGMSNAFVGITWLDQNHTQQKYDEHLSKCKAELLKFNFREENIYPICSKIRLLERTSPESNELTEILNKADKFPGLREGYEDLEYALKYSLKNELPYKRVQQATDIAQRRLIPHVTQATAIGRQIIPEFIQEEKMLDEEIATGNIEEWSKIFNTLRYQPTVKDALRWKKKILIFDQDNQSKELLEYIKSEFDIAMKAASITVTDLAELMLADEDLKDGFELSHRHVEDQERSKLVTKLEEVIEVVSLKAAHYIYTHFIDDFVDRLNKICPEERVFQTEKAVEHCNYEILALFKRVAIPLIRASLRWAHDNEAPRTAAVRELTLVVPWISIKVCAGSSDTPNLTTLVSKALGWTELLNDRARLPGSIEKLLYWADTGRSKSSKEKIKNLGKSVSDAFIPAPIAKTVDGLLDLI